MKLFWSSRSPFARKVTVTAHEAGLFDQLELIPAVVSPWTPNLELRPLNPLIQLPVLITDSGDTLFDSTVICEYLDHHHAGPPLFPPAGPARWEALRQQVIADGLLEVGLLLRIENRRKPENRDAPFLEALQTKFLAVLDRLENEAAALTVAPFGIAQIATGCALSYLDFRFKDVEWRKTRPALAAWHAGFTSRDSAKATEYYDPQ